MITQKSMLLRRKTLVIEEMTSYTLTFPANKIGILVYTVYTLKLSSW